MCLETRQRAFEAQGPSNQNNALATNAITIDSYSNGPYSVSGSGGRGGSKRGDATHLIQQKITVTICPLGLQDENNLVEIMRGNAIKSIKVIIELG